VYGGVRDDILTMLHFYPILVVRHSFSRIVTRFIFGSRLTQINQGSRVCTIKNSNYYGHFLRFAAQATPCCVLLQIIFRATAPRVLFHVA
jgi:hypothetical protein